MTTDEQITALQRQIKRLKVLICALFAVSLVLVVLTENDVLNVEDRVDVLETNPAASGDGANLGSSAIDESLVQCLENRDDALSDSLSRAMGVVDRALGRGDAGIRGSQGWSVGPRLYPCG